MYPMQPPAQPGVAYMPSETSNQPAYNPAYMQPPKTGYWTVTVWQISHCWIVEVDALSRGNKNVPNLMWIIQE